MNRRRRNGYRGQKSNSPSNKPHQQKSPMSMGGGVTNKIREDQIAEGRKMMLAEIEEEKLRDKNAK
jgi:hypothetical protein